MQQVTVIGAGTMATVLLMFAMNDYKVCLVDVSADALERARRLSKRILTVCLKSVYGEERATLNNLSTFTILKTV